MKAFKVTGSFRMGRENEKFTKEVASSDKEKAMEFILSDLGSKHKVKRYDIRIDNVQELKPEEITDARVTYVINEMKK
jgi:large subunit ribosomal protein LX